MITLRTTQGDIAIELDFANAPTSAANYLQYARDGFYNGTIFHRVIPGFMVQGGGFTPEMKEKETMSPIKNEANNMVSNERGTIAMARTNDPHSASAQFFINLKDNYRLDKLTYSGVSGFPVIAKVIEGKENVMKFYSGYGDKLGRQQEKINKNGNTFLRKNYPKVDYIITAYLIKE